MLLFNTTYKLQDIIKKMISIFVIYFYNLKHFWLKIAHYNFWCEYPNICILPKKIRKKVINKRFKLIYSFLDNKYNNFIQKYTTKQINTGINTKKIWVMWRQWEEKMPEIVKICYESIKKHSCDFDVILLTKDNYRDYIDLPEFILKKVSKWLISITHLSDIIRMRLLSLYWWIRIDATMYICSDALKEFSNINLNSSYSDKWDNKRTVFFIWWKTNRLFNFCYDFFIQYHKDYDKIIDYLLIDYVIRLAYNYFDDVKKDIDSCTLRNEEINTLYEKFNEKYEEKYYKHILSYWFFKLSFKRKLSVKTKEWKITNYWKFLEDNK